ncbi:MAG: lysine--tRNA ligase [Armatimonadota bacterium]
MAEDIREHRLAKLAQLRELGHDPYAVEKHALTDSANGLLARYDELAPPEGAEPDQHLISFAGRIVALQDRGKVWFAHLSDGEGRIQLYVRRDQMSESEFEAFQLLDVGDHLGVTGYLFTTRTGEKTIHVRTVTPLSKTLHQVPIGKEKDGQSWYALSDVNLRYRHRNLDLIANKDARHMLLTRSKVVQGVREFFWGQGFVEVETPMLQVEAGGAPGARPFHTFFNHYEMEVKLRISLELYLKRILCGDVPKVFEVGRVFRNEGVSNRHNPEFTMIEWYEAFVNLEDTQKRVEDCFRAVTMKIFGTTQVTVPHGDAEVVLDFGKDWARIDMMEDIASKTGVDKAVFTDLATAKAALAAAEVEKKAAALGSEIKLEKETQLGGLIEKLLEVFIEPNLIQPTFVVGYPLETSPLAKKDPARPGYTRRSEGYVLGREVCNLFSEINDPIDQQERFEAQVAHKEQGVHDTHPMDDDFVYALECGMPPAGGCGIGIDRMAMLLTGAEHIREILMFPMMKPVASSEEKSDS